jgi:putative oxidoreductase
MKKCWCDSPAYRNLALLIGRVLLGAIFVMAGWSKVSGIEGTTEMFGGIGFPVPVFFAWLVGLVEFVGGIGLVLGIFTKIWSQLLAVVMLVAVLVVHIPAGDNLMAMGLPLSLLAATLVLSTTGGGAWKVWSKECPMS